MSWIVNFPIPLLQVCFTLYLCTDFLQHWLRKFECLQGTILTLILFFDFHWDSISTLTQQGVAKTEISSGVESSRAKLATMLFFMSFNQKWLNSLENFRWIYTEYAKVQRKVYSFFFSFVRELKAKCLDTGRLLSRRTHYRHTF